MKVGAGPRTMSSMVRTGTASVAALALATIVVGGCADGGVSDDPCRAAADHVATCLGGESGPVPSSCDEASAQSVLELSCAELTDGGGKADELGDEARALLCELGDPAFCEDCPAITPAQRRGLWVWSSDVVGDIAAREALFGFSAEHQVTALYVNVEGLVTAEPAAVATFASEAAARCLETELLFGAPDWALAANHQVAVDLARRAVDLGGRALHFDVEPHLLAEWSTDRQTVANEYVDLLEALVPVARDGGARVTVDLPFWFDAQDVTRGDRTRPLSEWVAERVDRVALMDYRDEIDGTDGLVAHAATELAYAGSIGREVVVGVETACGELPKTTFCEEGAAALEAALAATAAAFSLDPGFAGVAVHHYAAYQALQP